MWETIILSILISGAFILGFLQGRAAGYYSAFDYWRRVYKQARSLDRNR